MCAISGPKLSEARFARALPRSKESWSEVGSSDRSTADRTGCDTQIGGVSESLYPGRTLLDGGGVVCGFGSWLMGESDLRDIVSGTT